MNTTKRKDLPRVRVELTTEPLTAAERNVWEKVWAKLLTDNRREERCDI